MEVPSLREEMFKIIDTAHFRMEEVALFLWHLTKLYSSSDTSLRISIETLTEQEIEILQRKAVMFVRNVSVVRLAHNSLKMELSQRVYKPAFAIFRVEVIPWLHNAITEDKQWEMNNYIKSLASLDDMSWGREAYVAETARDCAKRSGYSGSALDEMIVFSLEFESTKFGSGEGNVVLREEYDLED